MLKNVAPLHYYQRHHFHVSGLTETRFYSFECCLRLRILATALFRRSPQVQSLRGHAVCMRRKKTRVTRFFFFSSFHFLSESKIRVVEMKIGKKKNNQMVFLWVFVLVFGVILKNEPVTQIWMSCSIYF